MTQVAVVGCGWLGLPLALQLQLSGHKIVATCRTEQKAKNLRKLGFSCEPYQLGEDLRHQRFSNLFESSVLVLNIPVGRKNLSPESFVEHMESLLEQASSSQIKQVIFISTTSVYGDVEGIVTEQTPTIPQTRSGQINLTIEGLVKQYFSNTSTIVRPAGLVGEGRHPVHFLAGKQNLDNANQVVNLIHQKDVINAIQIVISNNVWGETLHLSAHEHPTRYHYYTYAAKQLALAPPCFIENLDMAKGKMIDATKSLQILGISLSYSSPFDMLGGEALNQHLAAP